MYSDIDTHDEDVEKLEALLARRFHRGKDKFKGKLPIYILTFFPSSSH